MASAATTSVLAGGVPPMSASSAAGWSWSYTMQNNQLGQFLGPIAWGTNNGTLLATNILVNPRRVAAAALNNSFRDFAFSQAGWRPGVDYVYFGIRPVGAGAVIDANNTGAGLAWNTGIVTHVFSTRTGALSNTGAAWVAQTARGHPTLGIGRGFFSFKIVDHGNQYYGWIELETVENANKDLTVTIHSWAYGTGSIIAGASAVPGGAGLAALAFGAAGLRGRRRSRN